MAPSNLLLSEIDKGDTYDDASEGGALADDARFVKQKCGFWGG
jgi:hypothetical protein